MADNSKRRLAGIAPSNSSRSWHLSRHVVYEPSDDFEALAEAVHTATAREIIRAGHTTNGTTNHPNLKPYAALSSDVKELVRSTVRAVLDELCLSRVVKGGRP